MMLNLEERIGSKTDEYRSAAHTSLLVLRAGRQHGRCSRDLTSRRRMGRKRVSRSPADRPSDKAVHPGAQRAGRDGFAGG